MKLNPTPYEFLTFLRLLLVWIGSLSLVFALLFFMAFNWTQLGSLYKFIIVEAAMFISIITYFFFDKVMLLQKVSLMLASISVGILLALIGQTYQTGADPWQLFAIWALFITPWVFVGKFSGLYLLWILLINMGTILYFQKFDLSLFTLFKMNDTLLLIIFGINTFLWLVWELVTIRYKEYKSQISIKFLAFFSMASISTLLIFTLFEEIEKMNTLYFIMYILYMVFIYYIFRIQKLNLYMMSLFALSLFFTTLSFFIRFVVSDMDEFSGVIFLMLIFISISTTMIVSWMKKLQGELL